MDAAGRSAGGAFQEKEVKKEMAQSFFGGIHPHDKKAATNQKPI